MTGEDRPRTGSQAVERALRLLRCFETGPTSRTLTDLAHQNGLTPSTTHRLLRALCATGFVQQDPSTERYGLGAALVALGARASESIGVEATRPALEALAASTGESVNLGVRDLDDVLVLVCVPSNQRLRFDQEEGSRVPIYASAMGKALLAFDADLDGTVASLPRLAKLTGSTITSRRELRAVLDDVRDRGWAINDQEREPGVRTVAAPVRNADGASVAAVAVQGPSLRMTDERIEQLVPEVVAAAEEVSSRLHARNDGGATA
jgi:DNA-binding IclR family transcriptional regulator